MGQDWQEPTRDQIESLLRAMVGRRVAVVGDVMLDEYLMGTVGRISPEAPVPVFDVTKEDRLLGAAANVAKCLITLGAGVSLCGVIGRDAHADLMLDKSRNIGIDTVGLVVDTTRPTTLKTRVVAKQQQMIRIDRESAGPIGEDIERELIARVEDALAEADAVVLSDYSKGTLTPRVCEAAIAAAREKGIPVVVDPKVLPWDHYRGATLIKPNRPEAGWFAGRDVATDDDAVAVARAISEQLDIPHALITRGSQGMTLFSPPGSSPTPASEESAQGTTKSGITPGSFHHYRAHPREVFDATGCGDIVATVLALALAAGADPPAAAHLANLAGAVEATKFGVAVVTDSEILDLVAGPRAAHDAKVLTRQQAADLAADLRRRGKSVVFTNGCFDILHIGHVTYLDASRQRGDALIVGINTDASVRRLKGAGRPVQNEHDRARILAGLNCTDAVVLFDEDTPLELIQALRPDVITKGSDYQKEGVVGGDLVESWGGRVELIELVEGKSTTRLIEKAGG